MSRYKLYNNDCLESMTEIPDNHIDMVFCDLPYGTTRNFWDNIIPFDALWENYDRIVKDTGVVLLTSQQPFTSKLIMSNLSNFRYEWIWEKNKSTGHLNANKMVMKSHENVCIFYKKSPTYNPQRTTGHKPFNAVKSKKNIERPNELRNYGHIEQTLEYKGGATDRHPRSIQKFPVINNDNPNKWHPTQKPEKLIEYFIKTYSNENDIVLDNCMGSGSTGIACLETNRKFVGIESNDKYFNLAKKWIEDTEFRKRTQFA